MSCARAMRESEKERERALESARLTTPCPLCAHDGVCSIPSCRRRRKILKRMPEMLFRMKNKMNKFLGHFLCGSVSKKLKVVNSPTWS